MRPNRPHRHLDPAIKNQKRRTPQIFRKHIMIQRINRTFQDPERLLMIVGVAGPEIEVFVCGFEDALGDETVAVLG